MNVVVIGAGVAGLVSAIKLRREGCDVTLLTKGIGGLQLSQGTVDVLGYEPERVMRPFDQLGDYAAKNPEHPYAKLDADTVRAGVAYLKELVGEDLLVGDGEENLFLPTAVGAWRPTAVAQPSMVAGALKDGDKVVVIGPRELKDFHPGLIADNLARQELPRGGRITARGVKIALPARGHEVDSSGLNYARALDTPAFRATFAAAIAPQIQGDEIVGLPAVLGLRDRDAWRDIERRLGRPVFEIPIAPPGVPGMRLNETLTSLAKAERVRYIPNAPVVGVEAGDGRITGVTYEVAGSTRTIPADAVVYAAGAFESGALELDSYGKITEALLDLPVRGADAEGLLEAKFWNNDQDLFRVGLAVDESMRVLDGAGNRVYSNLVAAGSAIAGAVRWSDKSGEGTALGSAIRAVDTIVKEMR